ncbi:MAG: ribosome hibernation-promoting factor, HPF/YfiA family [Gemmatimonadota bacterium]
MNVIISARHCEPPESIRDLAATRMQRLARYEPRLREAEVAFDVDHGERRVEARLSVPGTEIVVADAAGETFEEALGRVADRLRRQLRRGRERRRDHQGTSLTEFVAARAGGADSP